MDIRAKEGLAGMGEEKKEPFNLHHSLSKSNRQLYDGLYSKLIHVKMPQSVPEERMGPPIENTSQEWFFNSLGEGSG